MTDQMLRCKTCDVYIFGPNVILEHNHHSLWTMDDPPERIVTPGERMLKEENEMRRKFAKHEKLTAELQRAITNPGPNPKLHRETVARHRKEWPLLWKIIDRLLEVQ